MCFCIQIYYIIRSICIVCAVCFPSLANISPFHIPANWMEISIIHLLDFIYRYTHTHSLTRNWCWTIFAQRQTKICTGDQASKRCLAIAHMPRSMSCGSASASATTNIHMCLIIINSKFKWGNFTHFTQCELAVRLVGWLVYRHTYVCARVWFTKSEKKQRKKSIHNNSIKQQTEKFIQQSKWITQNTSISY